MLARPLYFPVKPEPLRMQAGLVRFGTDFGNGEVDRQYFPRDADTARYITEKARILAQHPERGASDVRDEAEAQTVVEARAWMASTLRAEGYGDLASLSLPELAARVSEDVAVVGRASSGADRVLYAHVCFPSGWRPEQVLGRSFAEIHGKIPAIEAVTRGAASLTRAMVSRGPYVRFVWTVSADDELDHHPEQGKQRAWSAFTPRGFLRVERQLTVPLPSESGSIFLIRTYVYGFDELTSSQRSDLSVALREMPPELLRYKRLELGQARALELLR
ncbi:MAG TPA: heme-dependent oxidative N-demethylase subunit alpha family protein [Polyangiaceae bacterium]|nr:heme-dependent oxidative N-demethylase subunit alpha family protein [Polyangiaceae bacterium]